MNEVAPAHQYQATFTVFSSSIHLIHPSQKKKIQATAQKLDMYVDQKR